MTKRIKPTRTEAPIVAAELVELERHEEAAAIETDGDILADLTKKNSVVRPLYKYRYLARAQKDPASHHRKAQKRSAWDWLAEKLAAECLDAKSKIDIEKFTRILELNGVDHSRWTNHSKGWEGRFRMTGRLALQRVVAETGILVVDGDEYEAPDYWIKIYKR